MISEFWTDLPSGHLLITQPKFDGATAVTSASGQGVVVQFYEHFYELACKIGSCSWTILPQILHQGVTKAVMMTLPSGYC